jgi:hypothetical protein
MITFSLSLLSRVPRGLEYRSKVARICYVGLIARHIIKKLRSIQLKNILSLTNPKGVITI